MAQARSKKAISRPKPPSGNSDADASHATPALDGLTPHRLTVARVDQPARGLAGVLLSYERISARQQGIRQTDLGRNFSDLAASTAVAVARAAPMPGRRQRTGFSHPRLQRGSIEALANLDSLFEPGHYSRNSWNHELANTKTPPTVAKSARNSKRTRRTRQPPRPGPRVNTSRSGGGSGGGERLRSASSRSSCTLVGRLMRSSRRSMPLSSGSSSSTGQGGNRPLSRVLARPAPGRAVGRNAGRGRAVGAGAPAVGGPAVGVCDAPAVAGVPARGRGRSPKAAPH
jgi:hypothetical protein